MFSVQIGPRAEDSPGWGRMRGLKRISAGRALGNTLVRLVHCPEGETEAKGVISSHGEALLRSGSSAFLFYIRENEAQRRTMTRPK